MGWGGGAFRCGLTHVDWAADGRHLQTDNTARQVRARARGACARARAPSSDSVTRTRTLWGGGGARRRGDGDCWLLNARAYDQQCTLCTYAQGRTFAGQWLICGGGIVCEPSIGSEHALPLFYLIV